MARSRQRKRQGNSTQEEHSIALGQQGLDLIQQCIEVGWLKSCEELQALSGVCRQINARLKQQVTDVHIPFSSLLDLQQRLAWRQLASLSSSTASHSCQTVQQQRPVTRGSVWQAGDTAAASAAKRRAATANTASASNGSSVKLPSDLQEYLSVRLPKVGTIRLHYNSIVQAHVMASQLQQLALIPQLTSLELKDSCSWALPCAGLSSISTLTGLKQLQLLVQSPGMPMSAAAGVGFPLVATAWQVHVTRGLSTVANLTQLQHLQLRFICGERGYFMSPTLLAVATALLQLSHLDLGYAEVKADGLSSLARLTRLDCLILYGSLSSLSAQDFGCLSSLRSLQRLEMFHDWPPAHEDAQVESTAWELTESQMEQLGASLVCLTQLSWLNLPMSIKCTGMLPLLQQLPGLSQLYLQSIERQQMEIPLASFAPAAKNLKVLQVDNVRLTAEGLASIAGLTQLQQLTLFNLLLDVSLDSHHCLSQLSRLSLLEQLCFDSLGAEPGAAAVMAVLDNVVLSMLAPHWTNLQSLHISYAVLPQGADLQLSCLAAFKALHNLSLCCFQQAGVHQQEVVLDAGCLPAGLQSLCLSMLTVNNAQLLPKALQHVWLADVLTSDLNPGQTLAEVISDHLHGLQTLVLRCGSLGGNPSVTTNDLISIAGGCPRLRCLGVSLPETNPDQIDLRVLAPLTGLEQLLLDYCAVDPTAEAQAPPDGAQQQQQQQQGLAAAAAAEWVPPPPAPLQNNHIMIPLQAWHDIGQQVANLAQMLDDIPQLPDPVMPAPQDEAPVAAAAVEEDEVQQLDEAGVHALPPAEGGAVPELQPPAAAENNVIAAAPDAAPVGNGDNVLHMDIPGAAAQGALQQPAEQQQQQQHAAAAAGEEGVGDFAAGVAAVPAAPQGPGPQQQPPAAPGQDAPEFVPMQGGQNGAGQLGAGFQDFPHQMPDFDAQEVAQQLSELGQHMTKLRGLWLSDNALCGAGLGLQQLLQQDMPYVTVRPTANDWFWSTNFPMGSCLSAENPMEWWRFTSWTIL